jgi:hypothetical protein
MRGGKVTFVRAGLPLTREDNLDIVREILK